MAQVIHQYIASIPANTPKATPVTIKLAVPNEVVAMIDVEVPPGPSGLMGFYLAMSGQQIIPFETGQFIVWDDREREWYLDDYATTGAWSVVGYNLDNVNAHAVSLRFHNNPLPTASAVSAPTINIVTIAADDSSVIL